MVDRRFDDGAQAFPKAFLRYVMLILSDADRLRIDFDQFRKRILQSARDRYGAAFSHVEIGEFIFRQL